MKHLCLILPIMLFTHGCKHPYAVVKEIPSKRMETSGRVAQDPIANLNRHLAAAEIALDNLNRNPADTGAMKAYNFAVSRICGTLRESKLTPWTKPLGVGPRVLCWKRDPRPEWNPARYEIIPADQLDIRGKYVDERETKDGVGAAMVIKRNADQAGEYAPTPHFFYGVTVVARFEGSRCTLAFEDPLEKETTRVGNHTYPLAADFTAPLALMLVEMHPKDLEMPRLLHPAKFAATTRIARLEPFTPDKTIVLVVHGLMDSPATWFPLINHMRSDPAIRRNYQFWFFSYPSGYPYPYVASILRHELDDAEHHYPTDKKMVVIGHSMGGCISRLLITDTGTSLWDQMFSVPPASMDLTPEHKHILTESTIFQHRPEIGRVIFISAPHRGSNLASDWIGRLSTHLVKLPDFLLTIGKEDARYEKHATGDLHLKRFPDSVDTLAPNNDFVLALHSIPVSPGIPYHTIAGDRGHGNSPNSSDGVVPYWSSHMENARSEKIVPSGHSAHQNREAMLEVERILKDHRPCDN